MRIGIDMHAVNDFMQGALTYVLNIVTELPKIDKKRGFREKLVIAGMKYFDYEKLIDRVDELDLRGEVLFTGKVAQEDLPLIYNGANLFAYLPIAEGFGIPPLEAMACGVPVITSDRSSLPEVVGDSGFLVDPLSVQSIADGIG